MSHASSLALTGRRRFASLAFPLVACAALFGFSSTAAASDYGVPSPPQSASVGQTNVPTSFAVRNSGAPGSTTTVGLITVVMACDTPGGSVPGTYSSCPASAVEPGVLRPSATGTGRAGTDCAGMTFTITQIDALQDKYEISAGAPFTIVSNSCLIDYTVDVLRQPTQDVNVNQPGIQTWQLGFASDGTPENGFCNPGCGSNVAYGVGPAQAPVDTDGDGVPDSTDQCVSQPGPAPSGCPAPVDTDGDGVPDSTDQCVSQPGPAPTGCPAAPPSEVPTSQDQCKKDGWRNYGAMFSNQGDCVSYVATHGKNPPAGKV
jgi:hypothetical protein